MKTPGPEIFLRWWPVVVRYTGAGIAIYATLHDRVSRPELYILAGAMMALSELMRGKHNGKEK